MIMRRSHNPTETQVYFMLQDDSKALQGISKAPVESQKEFWTQKFRGAGWETDRFLEGLKSTENFYCQDVVQVRIDTWHKGRVVLLGDAAHCPSPLSGMGTSSSLVGAYVLAGEINRSPDNLAEAFAKYDQKLRPFINEIQKVYPLLLRWAIPKTQWGVNCFRFLAWLFCFLRIPELLRIFTTDERGGWKLPDYPELKPYPYGSPAPPSDHHSSFRHIHTTRS